MHAAFGRMPYQETEDRAWVLTQIGHLELSAAARCGERALEQALQLFPNYHYALGALAEVRTAQKRLPRGRRPATAALRGRAASREPLRAGRGAGERRHDRRGGAELRAVRGRRPSRNERARTTPTASSSSYLVGAGKKPAEGALAEQEFARREDVYTREAYAWALFKNGRRAAARKQIAAVLAVGVQHPRVLERAALIQARRRRRAGELRHAVTFGPSAEPCGADDASSQCASCVVNWGSSGFPGVLAMTAIADRGYVIPTRSSPPSGWPSTRRSRRAHHRVERGHAALRRPATSPAPSRSTGPPT